MYPILERKLDGGYGWVIVFSSFMTQFLVGGILFSFGLFFVAMSNEFNSTGKSGISWIASIMIAFSGLIGPIASIFVNKYGCRTVSLIGSIIGALGFGISYFAESVISLYFTIGIAGGLGLGFMYFPSVVIVHQYFSKRRSTAIGICVCGTGLGTFFFQWIFGIIFTKFSWRFALVIESGAILLSLFLGMLYRPIQPPQQLYQETSEIAIWEDDSLTSESNNTKIKKEMNHLSKTQLQKQREGIQLSQFIKKSIDMSLVKDPLFIAYTLCDILASFGYNVPYVYLPEIENKYEDSGKSILLGIVGISNIISRLFSGYLSDKPWMNRLYLYNGAIILIGIGMILIPHIHSIWTLRGYASIFGLSIGILNSLKTVVLVDLVGPEKFSDAFGLSLFVSSIAVMLGPPVVGLLYDINGTYQPGFYTVGSTVALSGVIMLILVPTIKTFQRNKLKSRFLKTEKC